MTSTHTLGRILAPAAQAALIQHYAGPERRNASTPMGTWLAATLDEIDYGVLLLNDARTVAHANHSARVELENDHPLQLVGEYLQTRHTRDAGQLREAVAAASQRGLRRMLTLGQPVRQVTVAVVPLPRLGQELHAVALVLSKRQVCGQLSVQGFARCQGLTQAETAVLQALCDGQKPAQVAASNGVAMSTIRSQIDSLRAKTGAASIRELLTQIATLPPLVSALGRVVGPH